MKIRSVVKMFIVLWIFLLFAGGSSSAFAEEQNLLIPLRIQQGTNLIHIARKYCTHPSDWKELARINKLKSPYTIHARSTLYIPASLLVMKKATALVAALSGSPQLVSQTGTVVLHKGDNVLPGQTVVTGPGEYVHLVYPDNRHTRIGPDSVLRLVYLMRLADDNLQARFFLEKGRITHQIDVKLKPNEHFQTKTPVALTGVRGTEFRLKMEDEQTGLVETLKGVVAVDAAGKQLRIPRGRGSLVKKGQPPSRPRLLPVPPKAIPLKDYYRVLPVVLPAPAHAAARTIRLRLTRDRQGTETVNTFSAAPGKNIIIPSLADGSYFFFLTAVDRENFESLPAGPFEIKVRTDPAAPLISKPKNGRTVFTPTVTIKWLQSDQASAYKTQLAADADFSTIIDEQELTTSSLTTVPLEPGKYFFRVQLVTEDGFHTLYSVPVSWTVLEKPDLGDGKPTVNEDGSIQLQWSPVAGATGYMLQVAEDTDFTRMVVDEQSLESPSCTITDYLAPGKYFVRIQPILEGGLESPWTPPQTMTIDDPPFGVQDVIAILIFAAVALL